MKSLLSFVFFIVLLTSHAQVSDFEQINFDKADSIAAAYKNDGLSNMPQLVHHLTSQLTTDVEKFRAIYRWVCSNIANDYSLYSKNMRKRERYKDDSLKLTTWNDNFRKISFKTLLNKNRTICTGYAYILKELSGLANIECEIVNGFARTSMIDVETLHTPNHSWNAVEINGKWYLCDPTWASGVPNAISNRFEFMYNDGFFLTNPEIFAINHYPIDDHWWLLPDEPPTFQDFLEAPVFYGKTYTHLSRYHEPINMHNTVKKNEPVTFKGYLLNDIDIHDITLVLDNGTNSFSVHPKDISINDKTLTIEFMFKHSGFYDVHLMFGKDLISSYTFKVKS